GGCENTATMADAQRLLDMLKRSWNEELDQTFEEGQPKWRNQFCQLVISNGIARVQAAWEIYKNEESHSKLPLVAFLRLCRQLDYRASKRRAKEPLTTAVIKASSDIAEMRHALNFNVGLSAEELAKVQMISDRGHATDEEMAWLRGTYNRAKKTEDSSSDLF